MEARRWVNSNAFFIEGDTKAKRDKMNIILHLAYKQNNIPRTPIDDFIEGFQGMGHGQIAILIIGLLTLLFCINIIVKRDKYLPESDTLKYYYGYPSFDEPREGVIEIKGWSVIFKEFIGDKIFFSIPLKQIIDVKTEFKLMSALTYWAIGVPGIATEKHYLIIKFKQEDKDYSVQFSTNRESLVSIKLKKQILEAMKKVGNDS